jgi:uncharacterized protein YndB with AHSA1/START domain
MSGEGGVIEREILISASPETVFGFLIDPALMAHWIGAFHKLESHAGGIFQVEVSPGNVARGVFTEVTPPHRVAFTWGWESEDPTLAMVPPGTSLVEIELVRVASGTLLRFRHSRLPEATSEMHRKRWSHYLGRLQSAAMSMVEVRRSS